MQQGASAALSSDDGVDIMELHLNNVSLNFERAHIIADSIGNHPSLQSLIIEHNKLGWEGADVITYALRDNKILKRPAIGRCKIGSGGGMSIAALSSTTTASWRSTYQ